ncbi:MAG: hypothetical protein H0W88_05600 [Parachlamydiaceae bacterium]|nr:hypothetical protein [Parachlamydiaceae bacterium]
MPSINIINNSSSNNNFEVFQKAALKAQTFASMQTDSHHVAGGELHAHTIEKILDIYDDPGLEPAGKGVKDKIARDAKEIVRLDGSISYEEETLIDAELNKDDDAIVYYTEQIKLNKALLIEVNSKLDRALHANLPKIIENVNQLILDLKLPIGHQFQFDTNFNFKNFKDLLIASGGDFFFSAQQASHVKYLANIIISYQKSRENDERSLVIDEKKLVEEEKKNPLNEEHILTLKDTIQKLSNSIHNLNLQISSLKTDILNEFKKIVEPEPLAQEKVANGQGLFGLPSTQNQDAVISSKKKISSIKKRGIKV